MKVWSKRSALKPDTSFQSYLFTIAFNSIKKSFNLSVNQIAEEMGVSSKTIENQGTEAMRFLKKKFEDELPGGLLFFALFNKK